MRKIANILCAVCLAGSLTPAAAFAQEAPSVPQDASQGASADDGAGLERKQGEVIVVLEKNRPARSGMTTLGKTGMSVSDVLMEETQDRGTVVKVAVPDDVTVDESIQMLSEDPDVAYAQPNYVYRLLDEPVTSGSYDPQSSFEPATTFVDDPAAQSFDGQEPVNQYWLQVVGAPEAWDYATAEGKVTVAVLDTGMRMTHEDLSGVVDAAHAWDAFSNAPLTGDVNGRGTHVAGIVAAEANNARGLAGASYNATVLPVKVFDNNSYEPGASTADICSAYEYLFGLVDAGSVGNLRVVNMSLGGYGAPGEADRLLESNIVKARNQYGILTVVAGGNGDDYGNPITQNSYPSDFEACMAVTSLGIEGTHSSWCDYNAAKDIAAPGEYLYSTYADGDASYQQLSGTSMASPLVAGSAALLFAYDPTLSVDRAYALIQETASEVPAIPGRDNALYGAGCIDIEAALMKLDAESGGVGRTPLTPQMVERFDASYGFTGRTFAPGLVVKDGSKLLEEGVDYTLSYEKDGKRIAASAVRNAGSYTMVISGRKDYAQTISLPFEILPANAADIEVTGLQERYVHTGQPIAVEPVLTYRGAVLQEGTDYTLAYRDASGASADAANLVEIGSYAIVIQGGQNFTGQRSVSFSITRRPIGACLIAGTQAAYPYTGSPQTIRLSVVEDGKLLTENVDYTVSFKDGEGKPIDASDVVKPGSYTLVVTGAGAYEGVVERAFRIVGSAPSANNLLASMVGGVPSFVAYTGSPIAVVPTVVYGGVVLKAGSEYVFEVFDESGVSVAPNALRDCGMYSVVVKGVGEYGGVVTKTIVVSPRAITASMVSGVDARVELPWSDPAPVRLAPKVEAAGTLLVEGADYTVELFDESGAAVPDRAIAAPGTYRFVIAGAGNYAGTVSKRIVAVQGGIPFADVPSSSWYVQDGWLAYVTREGLMNGYEGTSLFGPEDGVTRGQVAVILHRMAESRGAAQALADPLAFADVQPDAYFAKAVQWASSAGIITGYEKDGALVFEPEKRASREEIATMIARFAGYIQTGSATIPKARPGALQGMARVELISPWAADGLAWCADAGIVSGNAATTPPSVDAQGPATRAQMAKMITVLDRDVFAR